MIPDLAFNDRRGRINDPVSSLMLMARLPQNTNCKAGRNSAGKAFPSAGKWERERETFWTFPECPHCRQQEPWQHRWPQPSRIPTTGETGFMPQCHNPQYLHHYVRDCPVLLLRTTRRGTFVVACHLTVLSDQQLPFQEKPT